MSEKGVSQIMILSVWEKISNFNFTFFSVLFEGVSMKVYILWTFKLMLTLKLKCHWHFSSLYFKVFTYISTWADTVTKAADDISVATPWLLSGLLGKVSSLSWMSSWLVASSQQKVQGSDSNLCPRPVSFSSFKNSFFFFFFCQRHTKNFKSVISLTITVLLIGWKSYWEEVGGNVFTFTSL